MEEAITDALAEAGMLLAEAVRAGLVERGLPGELIVTVADGRVRIVSQSAAVRDAEIGRLGSPPTAPMENAARAGLHDVMNVLHNRLQGALG